MTLTATYDPADNKLRLRSIARLDKPDYTRVRAAGFIWAPRQNLFVAPMWTPEREDLLLEFAGEIGDEDTSLVDRAEERAERFEEYATKRQQDGENAHAGVERITSGIPLGQPILVGHHSERHARKDAERIENGMRKAVKMWETAKYWESRARGALRHAKYKESPGVRHRRIKGLMADERKFLKERQEALDWIKQWGQLNAPKKDGTPATDETRGIRATHFANYCHLTLPIVEGETYGTSLWSALNDHHITPRAAQLFALKRFASRIPRLNRWLAHTRNRLTYERALLDEAGGLITTSSQYPIVIGGRVLVGDEWVMVLKINRGPGGVVNSLRTQKPVKYWSSKIPIERVKDYQPPSVADTKLAKTVMKLPPLVNYKGDGFMDLTTAEYQRRIRSQMAATRVVEATETHGRHRQREAMKGGYSGLANVFITDAKVVNRPSVEDSPARPIIDRVSADVKAPTPVARAAKPATKLDTVREQLKAGVKVVVAHQLFPTPAALAIQLVKAADVQSGHRVLEPSAGMGSLVRAIHNAFVGADCGRLTAVEVDTRLHSELLELKRRTLHTTDHNFTLWQADFLSLTLEQLGTFHRIVMNPPFKNGADIRHILHARKFLKPGGRLAAFCANGPRQQDILEDIALEYTALPKGSFTESGTDVNVALVVLDAEAEAVQAPAPARRRRAR